jgi:hypothetical protein
MCVLKSKNTVTQEFQLVAGQSKYLFSGLQNLNDKIVYGFAFVDPTNITQSPLENSMASLACVSSTYLNILKTDQSLLLDTFPAKNAIINVNQPEVTLIEPQAIDVNKSNIQIPAAVVSANAGDSVLLVIYFDNDSCVK